MSIQRYQPCCCEEELVDGEFVKYDEHKRLLETMEADRDAEKDMKAKARMQRDKQTTKNKALLARIKELESLLEYDLDDCK